MTDVVTDLVLPALSNQPNVEIAQTGQWNISTGLVTLTDDDFANAIAAMDCPAVRSPVLKLGHTDTRFNQPIGDGQPTVGWVANMATTDNGHTIVGDYTGMPGWLGPILPSAYPDRSMEATWDFMCQLGHVHPFVITAVALLGETPPGIGTLESLQDVASLYGVNMAASSANGKGFSVTIQASRREPTMPNPNPREVAAGVTTEDIRRTYYETAAYTTWIKEFELNPLQLITIDEATGQYARVPVTVSDSGEFEFGEAIPVEIEYVDKPQSADATTTAASAGDRIVYASKDESRPAEKPKPVQKSETTLKPTDAIKRVHAASNSGTNEGREPGDMDSAKIRKALGLPDDASDDDVYAAIAAGRPQTPEPVPAPAQDPAPAPVPVAAGSGVVVLDQSIVAEMKRQAEQGAVAFEQMRKNERDQIIQAAIRDGKFAPARKAAWEKLWDADPEGTRTQIENLTPNLVPLQASGFAGSDEFAANESYYGLYPEDAPAERAR